MALKALVSFLATGSEMKRLGLVPLFTSCSHKSKSQINNFRWNFFVVILGDLFSKIDLDRHSDEVEIH